MATKYDAIIIGGGHNGLVNAAYLARAGLKVLCLEKRHLVGGSAVTEEIFPGFKFSVLSNVVSLLRPEIIRDLELPKHGLDLLPLESSFTPTSDGQPSLCRWADGEMTRRELAAHSPLDAEAAIEFGQKMHQLSRFVKPVLGMTPPDPSSLNPGGMLELWGLGKRFHELTRELKFDKAKLMTMSAYEFLDRWFESEILKATMSVSGIIGTFLGPRSPGTAYVLLHHYMGEIDGAYRAWGFSRGGMGRISESIASSARSHGADVRVSAGVAKIKVKNGRATGVVLENGDEFDSKIVVSGVDPKLTFLKLTDEKHLPSDFVKKIKHFKIRGSSGKVNFALDALPDFKCRPGDTSPLFGDIAISPHIDYLERAYDDAKYGDISRRPYINMLIPSLSDPSIAPPGKHVMTCFVQYAPYKLANGQWDDAKREQFGDTVVDTIAEYAPNIRDIILHRQVISPLDMETEYGLTEGNVFHGELSLEQLFFLRPVAGFADYRTPLKSLYMCGSGVHLGGGVMGAPGKDAAGEILKDLKIGGPQ